MGDVMRPVPFEQLLQRIAAEYRSEGSIFGIAADQIYSDDGSRRIRVHSQYAASPVGPAAGPHTQLAQNIIASYLTGGRFIELKTVQKLDTLEIDKPCIDARDEGYNVEWSTEFTLEKAYDEYLKAWVILHLLEELITGSPVETPSFIFNMSVGYDLAGIQTEKMQKFIDQMIDASASEQFTGYLDELEALIGEGSLLEGTGWEDAWRRLKGISARISPAVSPSVTLSTMHGCPPQEIEAICAYMLTEKKLDTFVKLNPTLLGYDQVRSILDHLGYDYLHIDPESFTRDLKYDDAVAMLTRLMKLAETGGRKFGIKLTNTLGSVNDQGSLPGSDMYASGRPLYPLSITLAARLAEDFDGRLPISYSGGARAENIREIFETGIRPITLATDLLKPGGYARMKQLSEICRDASSWEIEQIDVSRLSALAVSALDAPYAQKDFRGEDVITTKAPLPLLDCYVAPCKSACPIGQDVPEYIYLIGQGEYEQALSVIYETNALPNITGYICDHQCMFNCTRLDYEGAVEIREMKRIAAEKGFEQYLQQWERPQQSSVRAAVVGAGPAGLSAAYFLARSGFDVTVFERLESAGGVVEHVIPGFRLPESAIRADIEFIERHGVNFVFGVEPGMITAESLKEEGFAHIFYALGAQKDNPIPLEGDRSRLIEALDFLGSFRRDPSRISLGSRVAVVGGGNTAMDSARAALRIEGVEQVDVLYRRTLREMPADMEEYDNAVNEGAKFRFLTNPERMSEDGRLTCRIMELTDSDESGRRRPRPTEETLTLQVDSMITAIGEHVDSQMLTRLGIPITESGWAGVSEETLETELENVYMIGDAHSGPSTVVECIASARQAVEAALDRELGPEEREDESCEVGCTCDDHDHDHDHDELTGEELEEIDRQEQAFFADIRAKKGIIRPQALQGLPDEEFGRIEASRCLECSYICNKCVEVCPNRANVAVDVRDTGLFENPYQIVHLDAFCNECGNCATFCPWEGKPYTDKFTIFSGLDDFHNSLNQGIFVDGAAVLMRIGDRVEQLSIDEQGGLSGHGLSEELAALIETVLADYSYLLGEVDQQ